jgi:hypothetical protein
MSSSAATEKPACLAGYEGNPTKVKTAEKVSVVTRYMNNI